MRTTTRKNTDGSVTTYYQLAHNTRNPKTKVPEVKVIYNFGRADTLNRDDLVRLCRSIARVCGVTVTDSITPEQTSTSKEQAGLPEDIKLVRSLELGAVFVIEQLWERLGIGSELRSIAKNTGDKIPYDKALLAMTANRLCQPQSKLGVWDRWLATVYLPSCRGLMLAHMYKAMDFLYENSEEIEKAVFFRTANLFNTDIDLIFYDTTTVSFSIDYEDDDSGLRKYGKSKDGGWSPQVVVALAVTREGLPVRSWVFPGNTADVKTVEQVKSDLKGWKLGRALFVADAGMNSEDNRQELAKACGKYLLATRMCSVKVRAALAIREIKEIVLSAKVRYKVISENLHAKEVIVGDGERRRRYILCYNPSEAQKQSKHREIVIEELKEILIKHTCHKATQQWAIELKASGRYKRYLTVDTQDCIRIDNDAIKNAAVYDGKWVITTNDDTISVEDAACGYKSLMVIESCFRTLKHTQIKIEPMHHWLTNRIVAHVKICVLALLIERTIELNCDQPWRQIKETLASLQVTEFKTAKLGFFQRNEINSKVKYTLKSLDISAPKAILEVSDKVSDSS
nr:IS1634 family transposase [Candidatus Magnetobacterium casensis]